MTEWPTSNPKPITRRSFLKKAGKFYLGLNAAGILTGAYSFKAERFWYQIKEIKLPLNNLPAAFKGWKIVQFSDVHLGFHYGTEDFQKVVKMINKLEPDIILFTGDLIEYGYDVPEGIIPLLQELKAPLGGKWAVLGNHDIVRREKLMQVYQSSQFNALINEHDFIESEGQRLYIAGINDVLYDFQDIPKAVQGLTGQDCVLLLAHEPDIADESSMHPVSAQFSGHSHGGQVRLPFYGSIIRQRLASTYSDGFYQVGERKMPLYVNRGIGTTNLAIRFFCRPEITVFHLT